MKKTTYVTRKGITQYKPVLAERQYLNAENNFIGFCVGCGKTRGECELDARQYTCEACGQPKVYGISELLMMGLCTIK